MVIAAGDAPCCGVPPAFGTALIWDIGTALIWGMAYAQSTNNDSN